MKRLERLGNKIPPDIANTPRIGTGGIKQQEIRYTADRSERVEIQAKEFYKLHGEIKEDIINHIMIIMKQVIKESIAS